MKYQSLEIEVIKFEIKDVITSSSGGDTDLPEIED